ncbi:rho GTPase-activating protein 17 isoform X2 [Ambystoma mexicanum]|uniref:rho GTPase-activating protein 17 isoform X2 n=1 Tax=Ambystoma mexicanum TaxID=8296 RepID=UPI0037E84504
MKKQFDRMRQLASQTVGRAEKTEVLSDDLLQIERRLDAVRMVCHNSHKRLTSCFQGQPGTDPEKRHKKLPLTALSQTMQEGSQQLGDDTLLGTMLDSCGDAENKLAMELSLYEVQLEKEILEPLNLLAETDIPNIQKQRKQLAKLVLDWDSARARWNQANKSLGTNFQMHPSKIDTLKEEMDEAENKVEQCRDQLAADMYNFVSKEGEHGRYFVMLLGAQAEYHRKALAVLEKVLPEIQAQQDKWTEKPAFGTPLEEHLKRSAREIALPLEACVMMLLETGMKEEGLFRIAAGASKLKKLKAALDCSTSQLQEFYSDPHAVAGALKSYLRELPEPLMTFSLYEEWIQAGNIPDPDKKLQGLWVICNKMPKANLDNFRYLIKFLAQLTHQSDVNKMTPSNIAIVLGPNLLWAKHEGTLAEMAAATSVHVVTIIEPIIQHADWFFPGELDFNVSGDFSSGASAMNVNHTSHIANDYTFDSGTLEKKRPVSMAIMESDLKNSSMGMKVLEFHVNPRRVGTVNRKHTSPAFQPPLPPTEAGLPLEAQLPPAGASDTSLAGAALAPPAGTADPLPNLGSEEPSAFKAKDPTSATTPPPLRNGILAHSVAPSQLQSVEGSGKLTVGAAQTAAGPSPHMARRATKKPAPAPPKPVILTPHVQIVNQTSPLPPSISPKPVARSPSPPSQSGGAAQSPSYSYGSLPRRFSGNLTAIHAPNHPPPQPPTLVTPPLQVKSNINIVPQPSALASSEPGTEQTTYTPPHTPTLPDIALLGTHQANSNPSQNSTSMAANTEVSQPSPPQTGTLPRPRPVPKPRNRPTIPPPPQPPVPNAMGETLPQSTSKIVTDTNSNVQAQLSEDPSPATALGKILHNHLLTLDIENDTESTAL